MQSPAPTGAGGAQPPITLSPVERSAFAHLFNLADPERTGIVTGDAAVSFFAKSKLPPAVLGQIWAMADSANNGFLTPPSFSIALRLISHAQRGETITEASTKRPGPPPTMEGVNLPLTSQLTGSQTTGAAPTNMPGVIEIKPEDRARYTRIFANSNPVGGLIDGDRAKEIFVKSKLPFDKLGAIWNLADTQARGALDLTDFIIAMHFIQNTMNGTLNSIPAALPPGLYEQAKGSGGVGSRVIPGSPLAAQNTGGSASGFGSAAIPRQMTGSSFPAQSAFQSPRQAVAAPAPVAAWDVTPEEKARADQFFDGLDVSKQGRLDGAAVVPFFMQSKLTESVLAHVWDLSDITQSGTLSKDEFAVAMHLINGQLAGKPLPQELPSSLVPPSMRSMDLPAAVNPQQSDTQKDLFSLMDDDPPAPTISASSAFITPSPAAPVVAAAAQSTPFGTSSPAPAAAPAPTQRSAPGPFDDDFFGGGGTTGTPVATQSTQPVAAALSPAATGGSFGSAAAFRSPGIASPGGAASPSASTSRLGTAFGAAVPAAAAGAAAGAAFGSGSGADHSAEYGTKSNELQSNEKAVSDLQAQRGTLESSVATNASSIAELESRLATVRGQHETESKLVKDLEERQQKQNAELKTLREEVIRNESELSALKAEKDELEQALMRDREDVRDMKKRMNDVQTETKSLKEQLEKLRKDARQQKGLVAISKKQLATAEGEQDKVASEIEAVQRGELGDEVAGHHEAATSAAPATRGAAAESVTSPAASVRSYNPFDRFGVGANPSSQPGTPGAAHSSSIGTSLAAGAGAGAVLGGVVAAAAHHGDDSHAATQTTEAGHDAIAQPQSREADPFGVQHADSQPHHGASSLGFDDAFAVPGESGAASTAAPAHGQTGSTDFDDNFGDDFGASATAVPGSAAEDPSAAEVAAAVPRSTDDHHASELAAAGGLGAGAGVLGASAIHAAQPSHDAEVSKELEPDASAEGPFGGEGTTTHERDAHEDEDSSDDDEEGPEEVGGYKARGYDAPVGGAADRFPEVDPPAEDAPTATAAQPDQAEEHTVPGGLGDVTAATTPASAAPVEPSAIGVIGERTASTTSIAPVSRQDTISSEIHEPSASESAQKQDTENSHLGAGTAAAGGIGVAALAAGTGALTLGERGHGDTTPSVSSPADDNVPLSQLIGSQGSKLTAPSTDVESTAAAEPSASPTLSTKTRRAPPPAPVRSATTLSTSSSAVPAAPAAASTVSAAEPAASTGAAAPSVAASTNPFGMDDFGAAPSGQHKAANDSGSGSNFDDFDSAFEDLGPSEAVPTTGAAAAAVPASAGAASGFDDAFDNDFDFVPSFSAPGATGGAAGGAGAVGESASRGAPTSGATGAGGSSAFDDFDAAFDSAPGAAHSAAGPSNSTTAAAAALPALGGAAGLGAVAAGSGSQHGERGSASNATSGFSFEDAFDPAGSSSTGNVAATTAPAVNTSTPSTSTPGVSSPSHVSSPTAPIGTYAPPPGPPPGFNPPPSLPSRTTRASTAIAEAEDYTGALPDDAAPVKQLCGMGFTREKVIQALEKSNYRTEKALERLLASA